MGGIDGDLGLVGWSCDVAISFVSFEVVLFAFLVAKPSMFVASAVCGRPRGLELMGGDNALGKVEKGVTPDDLTSCD